jgi:integrase
VRPESPDQNGSLPFCAKRTGCSCLDLYTHSRRRLRKTRVQPSQVDRSKPFAKKRPGKLYSRVSYQRAIRRACDRAGVPHWTPNQLRHLAATKIRAAYGLEAAQVILGHSKADVTQIYAARDLDKARLIVAQAG